LFVFGGEAYGTGSSRDWAAKGTQMLGVKVVVARGYERIHRSNLVGMGVLPCQFKGDDTIQSLKIDGSETFDIVGLENGVQAQQTIELRITRADGSQRSVTLLARVDTPIEERYLQHGGILPFVLRKLIHSSQAAHV
jgi:aconitate hydratase